MYHVTFKMTPWPVGGPIRSHPAVRTETTTVRDYGVETDDKALRERTRKDANEIKKTYSLEACATIQIIEITRREVSVD